MKDQDYTKTIFVNKTAREAFNGINSVTKWWTNNLKGSSEKLQDQFTVRFFDDIHVSTQRLVEVVPDKKVTWLVTSSRLNFLEDKNEWTGTKIHFEISEENNEIQIRFTHEGLTPACECYGDCSPAWGEYIDSLQSLINTGKGKPTLKQSLVNGKQ